MLYEIGSHADKLVGKQPIPALIHSDRKGWAFFRQDR